MEVDIRHIAKLSRLKVSDEEVVKFEKEMTSIIEMVENLPELDASGALIDPSNPMTLRKDEVYHPYKREDILKNAPQQQAGCIVVPKVVE